MLRIVVRLRVANKIEVNGEEFVRAEFGVS